MAVVSDDHWVLVDAGRGATLRAIEAGLDLGRLATVFITHHHSDHLCDLAAVATARWSAGAHGPLVVVAPVGPAAQFARRCLDAYADDCFHGQADPGATVRPQIEVRGFVAAVDQAEVWDDGRFRIGAALVDHHPIAPAVGYRIDLAEGPAVAVSGDTVVCRGIEQLAAGAQVLVHEAVLTARANSDLLEWNASAASVARMASAAGVDTLVLTHLLPAPVADEYEREVREAGWLGPLHVATDLLRLPLVC